MDLSEFELALNALGEERAFAIRSDQIAIEAPIEAGIDERLVIMEFDIQFIKPFVVSDRTDVGGLYGDNVHENRGVRMQRHGARLSKKGEARIFSHVEEKANINTFTLQFPRKHCGPGAC